MKKAVFLLTTIAMLFTLAACSENGGSAVAKTIKASGDYLFIFGDVASDKLFTDVQSVEVYDGRVFFSDCDANGLYSAYFADMETMKITQIPIPEQFKQFIWQIRFSGGDVWLLISDLTGSDEGENYGYSVVRLSADGELLLTVDLGAAVESGSTVQLFNIDSSGDVCFTIGDTLICVDQDGSVVRRIQAPHSITKLEKSSSGELIVVYLDDNLTRYIARLDPETYELAETAEFTLTSGMNFLFGGAEYDFFLTDMYTLYGYDLVTGVKTEILKWSSSNLIRDEVRALSYLGEDNIWFWLQDSTYSLELSEFIRKPVNEIPEKIALTYATTMLSDEMSRLIVDFNRQSEEYEIEIRTYDKRDYSQLDIDIVSGNCPDIIDLSNLPYEKYVSKGLLVDIYNLIDQYGEITKEDFVPGYLNAAEDSGGLYCISPDFYIFTFIGSEDVFGDEIGLGTDRFMQVLESLPDDTVLLSIYNNVQFLARLMYECLDVFADFDNRRVRKIN